MNKKKMVPAEDIDELYEGTLATGEGGYIVSVDAPAKVCEGDEVSVDVKVKNDGDKTSELYVILKNPEGRTIDKEPDLLYKSVAPGEEETITVSTHWDPLWAMPGYDWNLSVELWDGDLFSADDLLDTETFTVKLDTTPAEGGEITNVDYPATAREGDEFDVTTTVKNTGSKTSELRIYLEHSDGTPINSGPFTWKSVAPGETTDIVVSTNWAYGAMPDHDWDLRVVLYDIDLFSWDDRLDDESFTVELDTTPAEGGEITNVDYPATAREGDEFDVTTTVKNTGSKPSELRVYLQRSDGTTIDSKPTTYESVEPGKTADIVTSTEWSYGAMPDHDWDLKVVLYDIDLLSWKDRLDDESFTVELDTSATEGGEITDVEYPATAREGDEIEVKTTVKNTGSQTSEIRVYLRDASGNTIDRKPSTSRSVSAGGTATITTWADGDQSMPGEDYGLKVVVYDIDYLFWKDRLDDKSFTVELDEDNGNGGCSPEGAYSSDGTEICINGEWIPIGSGDECTAAEEGNYSADGTHICTNGEWVPVGTGGYCTAEEEGDYSADGTHVCAGGYWIPIGSEDECTAAEEGNYSADGTHICMNGTWVPVGSGDGLYLTVEQARERLLAGLPCYIKSVLPVLDMLPGIPYADWMWLPPFCAISKEP